jgi:ABC-type bacteriocin/lantibiotic exporter with double-glycine peptidase domain
MRLNSNAVVRENLTSGTLSSILDGLYVIVYLAFLFVGSKAMAAAALIAGALNVSVYLVMRRRQRELATQGLDTDMKAKSYEVEMLQAMETLKSSGNEHRAVGHWANLFVNAANVTIQRQRVNIHAESILEALRNAGPLLILGTGAVQVMNGGVTLGTMLALSTLSAGFLAPLAQLVETAMSLEVVRSYLARVNDVLEAQPEQDSSKVQGAPRLRGEVELENVSFSYGLRSPTIVNDVSVRIEPGQFVALVGRSGSGKSTLANLVLGLYRPTAGRIMFDGIDLGDLELRSVRRQLGIVNQQVTLFGTTIRDNIALSDQSLTLAEITAAARRACIHDEIMEMPLGYDTVIGDGGTSLSGGQRQRLALARALARKPSILLLDEATSALDALTEARVQSALDELKCTRIVIAHRLSTVRKADLILVVDEGAVVESGTHAELMELDGYYADLVASQLEVHHHDVEETSDEPVSAPSDSGVPVLKDEASLFPPLPAEVFARFTRPSASHSDGLARIQRPSNLVPLNLAREEVAAAVGMGPVRGNPRLAVRFGDDEATVVYPADVKAQALTRLRSDRAD